MENTENLPQIRCSQVKGRLKALEILDPTVRERVLQKFPAEIYKIIQETDGNQWVPVEYNITLCKCLLEELGEAGLHDFNLNASKYPMETSKWGTPLQTAINLFRVMPSAFQQLGPLVWNAMHRNCGDFDVIMMGPNHHQVVIKNIPQCILDCKAYQMGTTAAFQAIFAVINLSAKVTLTQLPGTKFAIYDITWEQTNKV